MPARARIDAATSEKSLDPEKKSGTSTTEFAFVGLTHADRVLYQKHAIDTIPGRLSALRGDPWEGYERAARSITADMKTEIAPVGGKR